MPHPTCLRYFHLAAGEQRASHKQNKGRGRLYHRCSGLLPASHELCDEAQWRAREAGVKKASSGEAGLEEASFGKEASWG